MRGPGGWMKLCFSTVIRPFDVAAIACSWLNAQSVAAPIPRFGSVCDDNVCLVPKPTSVWIDAWIRSALISFRIDFVSGETGGAARAPPCAERVASTDPAITATRPPSTAPTNA